MKMGDYTLDIKELDNAIGNIRNGLNMRSKKENRRLTDDRWICFSTLCK